MASPQAPGDVTPNPKQVVFLFMTATVVAVVVFLCGVLVGRGVPLVQPLLGDGGRGAAGTGLFGDERRPAVIDTPNAKPSAAATLGDELSYYWRLERDALFDEVLRDPRSSVEPPPPVADLPEPPTGSTVAAAEGLLPPAPFKEDVRSVTPESPTASRTVADSAAGAIARPAGFAVQVTALRGRAAAQSVADGLVAKGFPAFVMDPVTDAPRAVFRVRVGPFANRREAERVQQRLETEEHFKPWITR